MDDALDKLKERIQEEIDELEDQIDELYDEIDELRELISQYEECQKNISDAMEDWNGARKNYENILLESVFVKTYFEGVSAKNVKGTLLPTISSINGAAAKASKIQNAIPKQITLLKERITELLKQISKLKTEIRRLELKLEALE